MRLLAAAIASAGVAVACGGGDDSKTTPTNPASNADTPTATSTAQLFDVGGYKMSITCKGEGSPTVILDTGSFGTTADWAGVQAKVSQTTRVCSFERPGNGSSERRPEANIESAVVIDEMTKLFTAASIEKPFVFAGHSLGGLADRYYIQRHPDDVSGLVEVEGPHEDHLDLFGGPVLEEQSKIDWSDAIAALDAEHDLDDMPLVVLHGGRQKESPFTFPVWLEGHQSLAAMSTNSVLMEATSSGHFPHKEQPDVVAAAIEAVVDAVRADASITSCEEIIAGLDAKCLPLE